MIRPAIMATKVSSPQIRTPSLRRVWSLLDVAAEDLHGGNAQAQGEEGLVHSRGNDIAQAHVDAYIVHVGHQVEGNALPARRRG